MASAQSIRPRPWKGKPLRELFAWLDRETAGDDWWVVVALPQGARVGMRAARGEPRQVVIYRDEPFRTENGESLWASEASTFRRELGLIGWRCEARQTRGGGPMFLLTETAQPLDFFSGG